MLPYTVRGTVWVILYLFFILAHQTAVLGHIRGKDGSQLAYQGIRVQVAWFVGHLGGSTFGFAPYNTPPLPPV